MATSFKTVRLGSDNVDYSAADAAALAAATAHAARTDNPHSSTIAQVGEYAWTWADAAARLAQTGLTQSHVDKGIKGYQVDMQKAYRLIGVSPAVWAPLPDPRLGEPHWMIPVFGTTTMSASGLSFTLGNSGTATARTQANANAGTRMPRGGAVTAASAGALGLSRTGALSFMPFRLTMRCALVPSTNWRFFCGIGSTVDAFAANANPSTWRNTIAIGRGNGETNVQLYHASASAVTQVDIGASFPAAVLDSAYLLEIFTLDMLTYGVQVRNMESGAEYSTTFSSNVPAAPNVAAYWSSPNSDNSAVSCDAGKIVMAPYERIAA